MSEGSKDDLKGAARRVNKIYAAMIRSQMRKRGASVRTLAQEGVIKNHRRAGFFEKIEGGNLPLDEFQRILIRLEVDPVRAGIVLLCQQNASFYEDPCCETTALLARSLAVHLPSELADCEGEFEPIRESLGDSIAKRNASAIANHHRQIEQRRNGYGFEHPLG